MECVQTSHEVEGKLAEHHQQHLADLRSRQYALFVNSCCNLCNSEELKNSNQICVYMIVPRKEHDKKMAALTQQLEDQFTEEATALHKKREDLEARYQLSTDQTQVTCSCHQGHMSNFN